MVVLDMAPDEMKTARQPGQSWRAGGGDCRQAALFAAAGALAAFIAPASLQKQKQIKGPENASIERFDGFCRY